MAFGQAAGVRLTVSSWERLFDSWRPCAGGRGGRCVLPRVLLQAERRQAAQEQPHALPQPQVRVLAWQQACCPSLLLWDCPPLLLQAPLHLLLVRCVPAHTAHLELQQAPWRLQQHKPSCLNVCRDYFAIWEGTEVQQADGRYARYELVSCKCVDTYVRLKGNQNQICWKWRKVPPQSQAVLCWVLRRLGCESCVTDCGSVRSQALACIP